MFFLCTALSVQLLLLLAVQDECSGFSHTPQLVPFFSSRKNFPSVKGIEPLLPLHYSHRKIDLHTARRNSSLAYLPSLENLGHTCYANAVIQALFHSPYRKAVLSIDGSGGLRFKLGSVGQVLQFLFSKMESSLRSCSKEHVHVYDPVDIFMSMGIEVGWQEDAHEFMLWLVSMVDESLSATGGSIRQKPSRVITGKIKETIQFSAVPKNSYTPFTTIGLHLPPDEKQFVGCCLRSESTFYFLLKKSIFQEDKFEMPSRADLVAYLMTPLPESIYFHFYRFSYDRNLGQMYKVKTPVPLPLTVDLGPFIAEDSLTNDTQYELSSVIVHEGEEAECGHFVTYIRRGAEWVLLDDALPPQLVTYDQVFDRAVSNGGAYIVGYSLKVKPNLNII